MTYPNFPGGIPTDISNNIGIADYNDATTASTPINLVADTWTSLTNDESGASTNVGYLPSGVTSLLIGGGSLDLTELPIGSFIIVRPDYSVTPSSNNASLEFRYTLGAGGGAYTLEKNEGRLDLGAGRPYRRSLEAHFIYVGDANTRDNPVGIQVKLSTSGTVVNAGIALGVYKR